MTQFYLVQRGIFRNEGKTLTGTEGVVILDYMGSAEFEWGAIPKAYRRIMYHFKEYDIFHTGIYTPESEELMVFCRKDCKAEIIQAIQEFVERPYRLKEYSELEKVPKARKNDVSFEGRSSNFWWCIDIKSTGDWMAFLSPQSNLFSGAIKNDYNSWWMEKPAEKREEEYNTSRCR